MDNLTASLFELVFNQSSEPTLVLKADSPRFTIVASNKEHQLATNTVGQKITGKSLQEVFSTINQEDPGEFSMLLDGIEYCLETKSPVTLPHFRYDILKADTQPDDQTWWQVEVKPILDNKGEVEYIIGITHNITEQVNGRLSTVRDRQSQDTILRSLNLTEQLETSNERLEASNGKLEASNEKLKEYNLELNVYNNLSSRSQASLEIANTDLEKRVEIRTMEFLLAQAEAEAQRDRLRNFFMQAPAGICVLDGTEMVFELVNPLYQELFPNRVLLGKPILEAVPEIKNQPVWMILQDVIKTGHSYTGNELLIPLGTDDGGHAFDRYFNFSYQPRLNLQDEVDGILVFVFEVTEMVQSRRRIEQSERRFRSILNAIPQLAWTSLHDGSVNFYNQRWYDYTGLDQSQTDEWSWQLVIHPDDLQDTLNKYSSILSSNTSGEFETRYKRGDGQYRWHLNRMQAREIDDGSSTLWIATATDIEELKNMQQQKDDFVSIASHELKTPLTGLHLSIQMINEMKGELTPEMSVKLMQKATGSLNRIIVLVDELLNVSRLNQGMVRLKKSWFTVSSLLKDCAARLLADKKFRVELEGNLEIKAYADTERIEQVLVNLLNNSIRYAPDSDIIKIRIQELNTMVMISVIDTGPGIPAESLPHLFSRYYRVNNHSFHHTGLGLGLYICMEIIKKHGGQMNVKSVIGKGSTFWFTLPFP